MYISCSICKDLFTGIHPEVVHSTECGHLFHYQCLVAWLERSSTCPMCRTNIKKDKTVRLYFHLNEYDVQDSSTLENSVQSLLFQISMKEKDIKKLSEESEKAKKQTEGLRSEVLKSENIIRNHLTEVCLLQGKIKALKVQVSSLKECKLLVDDLQAKLEQFTYIEKLLKGSVNDAVETLRLMKDITDPSILCACLNTLKKETHAYKEKSKDLHNLLKLKEVKLASALTQIQHLENEKSILNRTVNKLKDDLNHIELENENLKKKCQNLGEVIMSEPKKSTDMRDEILRRLINEYPSPKLTNPELIDIDLTAQTMSLTNTSPVSPVPLYQKGKCKSFLNNPQLLNKKQSSVVECYDGLGGHSKEEIILTDRATLLEAVKKRKVSHSRTSKKLKTHFKTEPKMFTLDKYYNQKS